MARDGQKEILIEWLQTDRDIEEYKSHIDKKKIQRDMQTQNRKLCKKTEEKRYTNFRWYRVIQIKRNTNRQTRKTEKKREIQRKDRNKKERQKSL